MLYIFSARQYIQHTGLYSSIGRQCYTMYRTRNTTQECTQVKHVPTVHVPYKNKML